MAEYRLATDLIKIWETIEGSAISDEFYFEFYCFLKSQMVVSIWDLLDWRGAQKFFVVISRPFTRFMPKFFHGFCPNFWLSKNEGGRGTVPPAPRLIRLW